MVRITVVAVLLGALVLPAVALAVTRYGDRGVNRLNGEAGADRIVEARFGDDHIVGGPGNDLLVARRGNDTVFGGTGNDTIYGGTGLDTVDCGPGPRRPLHQRPQRPRAQPQLRDHQGDVRRCASASGTLRAGR
jgi:hypothetical protein